MYWSIHKYIDLQHHNLSSRSILASGSLEADIRIFQDQRFLFRTLYPSSNETLSYNTLHTPSASDRTNQMKQTHN